jgi:hypothetical protein
LVEQLPRIDIGDLVRLKVFPRDHHTRRSYEVGCRYPFLKTLTVSFAAVEANHVSGYTQRIKLKWIPTGFGGNWKPRPTFICPRCTRPVTKLYCNHGSLACRRCHDATYASRVCSRDKRPILQAKRIKAFLDLKAYMRQTTRERLRKRLAALPKQLNLSSKRLSADIIQRPQFNYSTRGPMLWL